MRILVVDNGSEPVPVVEGAEVIATGANLGFGPGANVGLRRWLDDPDAGEWALVLPHDALPEPGCVERLVGAAAGRSRAGLASAEFGDAEVPVVDPYFGGITMRAERGDGWQSVDYPHGTMMLLRRACLEEIGLFDESYFAYCEEADLGVRARRAGWEVGMVWGAVVRNPHQSEPSASVDYLMLRNSLFLVRRHFGRYKAFIRFCMAVGTALWLAVRPSRRTPWYSFAARRMALRDFLRGRLGPPPPELARIG